MEDNTIIDAVALHFVPSDGAPWAEFLKTKLSEKSYDINVQLYDITNTDSERDRCSVNILLFSPDFLDGQNLKDFNSFNSKASLAVLLGVEEKDYRKTLNEQNAKYVHYWNIFETQANESSVRFLLVEIIDLYEHVHEHSVETQHSDESQKPEYDVLPPPRPIDKNETPKPNQVFKIIDLGGQQDKEVLILLDNKEEKTITLETDDPDDKRITCESLDKAVYICKIQGGRGRGEVRVYTGDKALGSGRIGNKKEDIPQQIPTKTKTERSKLDTMKDLLADETDPIRLLCNAMSIEQHSVEALDHELANRFFKYRSLEELGNVFRRKEAPSCDSSGEGQWPSLLHFAADYNLIKFSQELLHFPGMGQHMNLRNEQGCTPGEIAQSKGHNDLADTLKRYSPGNKDSGIVYDIPDKTPEDELYQIPPPQPHVVLKKQYVNERKVEEKDNYTEELEDSREEDYVLPDTLKDMKLEDSNTDVQTRTSDIVNADDDEMLSPETDAMPLDSEEEDYEIPNPTPCSKARHIPRQSSDSVLKSEYMSMESLKRSSGDDKNITDPEYQNCGEQTQRAFRHHCHSESDIGKTEKPSVKCELHDHLSYTSPAFSPTEAESLKPPCECNTKQPIRKTMRSASIDYQTKIEISPKPKGFLEKFSAKLHLGRHRKNSLPVDPAMEAKMARYKTYGESPKDYRVSNISTSSSASTNSSSSIYDTPDSAFHADAVEEEAEGDSPAVQRKTSKKKNKSPFSSKRNKRKSIRIAHAMKDENLTVLELPKKKK